MRDLSSGTCGLTFPLLTGHLTTALAVWNNPSHLEMCLPKDDAHADILADYKPADWFSMRGDVDTIITRCFPARGKH